MPYFLSSLSNLQTVLVGWFHVINTFNILKCHLGGDNHIGSTQKSKLKIKYYFVVKHLDLNLTTYLG
jgi:hypothetical protein